MDWKDAASQFLNLTVHDTLHILDSLSIYASENLAAVGT
jgi:hypothetical protein